MGQAFESYLEKQRNELQVLRDGALRAAEKAYFEGDSDLFEEASSAFDQSTPAMEALRARIDVGEPDPIVSALTDLVVDIRRVETFPEEPRTLLKA
jgi:hypothetical protein